MSTSEPSGLLASLRRLLAGAVETAQVRLDLLAVELEQEKRRLLEAVMLAAGALLLLGVGLVLAVALLLMLLQEGYRLAALALLTLAFLGGAGMLLRLARDRLASPGGIAAASRAELARDRQSLAGGATAARPAAGGLAPPPAGRTAPRAGEERSQ
jgi:uncharacterized membrane protein YqjE